nr:hypothetical protein Iba_chr03aCG21920 [Ipomoea batatas]
MGPLCKFGWRRCAEVVVCSEKLVPELPEPYSELVHELPELDGGIVTQPEEIEDHNEVEDHNDEEEYEEQHGGVDARRKNSVKKPTLDDVECLLTASKIFTNERFSSIKAKMICTR